MLEARIQRRTHRILTRKPTRFNFTFDEAGALALTDLCEVPLFKRQDVTVEQLTAALNNDSENRFVIADGKVTLADVAPNEE